MNLLIISYTSHYIRDGMIVGWGPTIVEIDYISKIFTKIVHVAPLFKEPAPPSALPYTSDRVQFRPVPPSGGKKLLEKIGILKAVPYYLMATIEEMREADVIHVRCPANISLLTIILLTLMPRPRIRWVKYAGNWKPKEHGPLSYTFQRWWLRKNMHRGAVTINGKWPDQPKHIYTFFNPSFSQDEIENFKNTGNRKEIKPPYYLLFVGSLTKNKGPAKVLHIARELKNKAIPFEIHFAGDGPDRESLELWANAHGLSSHVVFHGFMPKYALADFYAKAHFLVSPSSSEGWPKVLSEAMAYGTIPITSSVSCIPQVLAEIGAGKALPPNDVNAFVNAILGYIAHPDRWEAEKCAAIQSANKFTYEKYLNELIHMFRLELRTSFF